ncbi:hypothetical protein D9758_008323 [Tetrapyrgos nigripes]|uniref:Uncharacterized protein n=1 Tax=Tetrapyrgos nigripes TaxID=182062 RepID=A0A8H5GDP1_9AGAR|nr:hypothetical protein D9758_016881 [Tetrapyrgos nigripes]KAF5363139.1 hypothetical protein D9758_008323 [Tetrapyrgos nigripes]
MASLTQTAPTVSSDLPKQTALEWANRVRANQPWRKCKVLTAETRHKLEIALTLDDVIEAAGGVKCNFHDPRHPLTGCDKYLVIIREDWGSFVEVDGVMEPGCEIKDPYAEQVGEKLLKAAGVEHESFVTIFL